VLRFLLLSLTLTALWWTNACSQSFGVSPSSHKLWGESTGITEFYVEYKFLGLHHFQNWDDSQFVVKGTSDIISNSSSLALSIVPLDLTYFRAGMIFFERRFPITKGSSNGFGMFNEINPGVDSFSVKVHFGGED